MRYAPKFYKNLLGEGLDGRYTYDQKYIKYAYVNGFAVGAVAARLEPIEDSNGNGGVQEEGKFDLYIMTINVLAAYRRRGVATHLLDFVLNAASQDERISEVFLHVQTSNDEAKNFYVTNGFTEMQVVENYYTRVEPSSAFLLKKKNVLVEKE